MIPVEVHGWPQWIRDLLHINPAQVPAEEASAWITLRRFPESGEWALVIIVALLSGFAAIGWIYRQEASLSRVRKVVLTTLRCAVLLAVALVLLGPVLEHDVTDRLEATTLVFIDDSMSFGIAEGYPADVDTRKRVAAAIGVEEKDVAELTRAQIAMRLLNDPDTRFLERLGTRNNYKVFTFSENPRPIAAPGPAAKIEIDTRGAVTNLGRAVRAVVESHGSTPIAAVVLITDGKITAGEDPTGLGSFLARREIPVHALGIGDPRPTRNVRIMAVFSPERVFLDDPLVVDVRLGHRGFEGETVRVDLVRVATNSGEGDGALQDVLKTVELTLGEPGGENAGDPDSNSGGGAETTARLDVLMDRVGSFRLIARVAPVEGETFDNDNARETRVEVIEQATRVLLIAGAPSNEFRILKNLLRRDRRVHLDAWLMSADPDAPQEGNSILKKLPSTPGELFDYDVVILNDPDARGFPARFAELLERFVGKNRGGLAFIAGEKYTERFLAAPQMRPIRALLAVEPDMSAIRHDFGQGRFHTTAWPIVPTSAAATHPATRFASRPDRNRERWAELPGIYWSLPVERARPGATVLLEHPSPRFAVRGVHRPLLASQFYEGGRSLFVGFDESWRWRSLFEEAYDQFWLQVVRSLTEGRLLGDRRQLVLTDRESYDLGDVIRISALLQDEDYEPSTADTVEVEVTPAGGKVEKLTLEKDPSRAGWFRGVFMPDSVGDQHIRLAGGAEKTVRVEVPELEYQDPRLDVATLQELATLTGGTVVPIEDFADLPDQIPDRSRRVVKRAEPRPLWDSSITLALVICLLSAEWALRKWSRLP